MAIAFRNSTSNTGTSVTSIVATVPSGVVNGDVMLMMLSTDNATTHVTPSGWTVASLNTAAVAKTLSLWWRVASSEPASYTVTIGAGGTGADSAVFISAWSGVDTTTPLDGVTPGLDNADVTGSSPHTRAHPAITTATANAWVVACLASDVQSNTTAQNWTSASQTVRVSVSALSFASIACGDVAQAVAGSSGTKSWTDTQSGGTNMLIGGWLVSLRAGATSFQPDEDSYKPPILPTDNPVGVYIG